MVTEITNRQRINRFFYFFPFQLVLLHLKKNLFLLIFWGILFAFTTESFATKFGIPYLFLSPEYLGEVGVWSYLILGFSLGGFIMSFNIYTYINHAFRFPFIATLSRPFIKFCINNFIIPLIFIIVYIVCAVRFMNNSQLLTTQEIFYNILGFVFGTILFIIISFLYFFPTNKNIFKITGKTPEEFDSLASRKKPGIRAKNNWRFTKNRKETWRVETYLAHPLKINLARNSLHYDRETLRRVFFQNHVNASFFEFLAVASFLILGAFHQNEALLIPAAASTCLLFTMILMVLSIFASWLKAWTTSVLVVLFLIINFYSKDYPIINSTNQAYGLNYNVDPIGYNSAVLDSLSHNPELAAKDRQHMEKILDKWLKQERFLKNDAAYKPKMLIINCSGGGLRSAFWTFRAMQFADSLLDGRLMQHTKMITGASGGTIGAAYYRELHLQNKLNKNYISDNIYQDKIATDILNPVLFSLVTNDVFIRFRREEIDGKVYTYDRAMAFEYALNRNTDSVLNKKVTAYYKPVVEGKIPMLILAPTIVNDGRRLLISSQPLSYLTDISEKLKQNVHPAIEHIEFNRLLAGHDAEDLLFTSALRMNSTFPYILPNATLPTEPAIDVMDAGLRDNFGTKLTALWLMVFNDWISKNTSGVVLLQFRDTQKGLMVVDDEISIADRLRNPIGSFYGNYFKDQDYDMDQLLMQAKQNLNTELHVIPLVLRKKEDENISLSWHLTELEKQRILHSVYLPENQTAFKKLEILMKD